MINHFSASDRQHYYVEQCNKWCVVITVEILSTTATKRNATPVTALILLLCIYWPTEPLSTLHSAYNDPLLRF